MDCDGDQFFSIRNDDPDNPDDQNFFSARNSPIEEISSKSAPMDIPGSNASEEEKSSPSEASSEELELIDKLAERLHIVSGAFKAATSESEQSSLERDSSLSARRSDSSMSSTNRSKLMQLRDEVKRLREELKKTQDELERDSSLSARQSSSSMSINRSKLMQLRDEMKELKEELRKTQDEKDELEEEFEDCKSQKGRLEKKIKKLEERIKDLDKTVKKQEDELHNKDCQLDSLQTSLTLKNPKELEALQKEKEELEKRNKALVQETVNLKRELKKQEEQFQTLAATNRGDETFSDDEWQEEKESLLKRIRESEKKVKELKRKNSELEEDKNDLQEEKEYAEQQLKKKEEKLESLRRKRVSSTESLFVGSIEDVSNEKKELANRVKELQQETEGLKTKLANAEEQLSSQTARISGDDEGDDWQTQKEELMNTHKSEIQKLQKKIRRIDETIKEKDNKIEELENEFDAELKKKDEKLEHLRRRMKSHSSESSSGESIEELKNAKKDLEKRIRILEQEKEECQAELEHLRTTQQLSPIEKTLQVTMNSMKKSHEESSQKHEEEIQSLNMALAKAEKELKDLREKVERLEKYNKSLRTQIDDDAWQLKNEKEDRQKIESTLKDMKIHQENLVKDQEQLKEDHRAELEKLSQQQQAQQTIGDIKLTTKQKSLEPKDVDKEFSYELQKQLYTSVKSLVDNEQLDNVAGIKDVRGNLDTLWQDLKEYVEFIKVQEMELKYRRFQMEQAGPTSKLSKVQEKANECITDLVGQVCYLSDRLQDLTAPGTVYKQPLPQYNASHNYVGQCCPSPKTI